MSDFNAKIDMAGAGELQLKAPVAVVENFGETRQVRVNFYQNSAKSSTFTSIVHGNGGDMKMNDKLNEIDTRLRTVETTISRIDERLKHMPTTVKCWSMVAFLAAAIFAIVQFLGPAIIKTSLKEAILEQAEQHKI